MRGCLMAWKWVESRKSFGYGRIERLIRHPSGDDVDCDLDIHGWN